MDIYVVLSSCAGQDVELVNELMHDFSFVHYLAAFHHLMQPFVIDDPVA